MIENYLTDQKPVINPVLALGEPVIEIVVPPANSDSPDKGDTPSWSGVIGYFKRIDTLIDGANVTLNSASDARYYDLTAVGDRTILAPLNPLYDGQKLIIRHKASGGARTLTLTTGSTGSFRFGVEPTVLTATASGKTDYIGCIYNKTDNKWDVVSVRKGF